MDEKTLQKNLASIDRELVNLQTAHEIGLGVVGYYSYEGTSTFQTSYYRLDIHVDDDEQAWPFLDAYLGSRGNVAYVQFQMLWAKDDSGRNFRLAIGGLGTKTYDWKIISTSKIDSIIEVPNE